ncbi:MAG: AAA family ATPase [Nitriliruptorales bacterium]|nr:AAA family ATPase [Nitriliruptorales bacterium]
MRVLLFTGKGGVGKTSVAAATAVRAAGLGRRTLVMSTDPAHSLADSFGVALGREPTIVAPNLEAEQIDAQQRLEDNWRDIRNYLVSLLSWGGVDTVEAEELSVIPGLEEIFSLIDVKRHVDSGKHDLLVVDCAPTAETLRLLSLPDALGWYLERIFPVERKVAKVVRPMLNRVTTMPLPQDQLFGAIDSLYRNLEGVRDILRDVSRTSVRLVVNAEKMVIAEARRTYTYLNLFGYHVDAVVVNRLLPDAVTDPWFDRWKALQAEHLATVEQGFAGVPMMRAPLFDEEIVGLDALDRLAQAVYGEDAVDEVLRHIEPPRFERTSDGYLLVLALPFVDRGDVDVFRTADELHVKVGPHHRSILLPAALARCEVVSAGIHGGDLRVRFASPDQGQERGA